MKQKAPFALRRRNPDVLSCIANLSNDEVFTPPEFANRMLDTLAAAWAGGNEGADLFADPNVRFLDPCTKSGVFLREIATRLVQGLEGQIPDLQARVDHILTHQVFGIATTELTSLMARRSLYCSKDATGPHSIAKGLTAPDGHIWFERQEHDWREGRCRFCGASRSSLDRGDALETHAYAFIHTDDIKARIEELFGVPMQFDVIIGNPPYQMTGGGGGTNDSPIYQHFVEQAMKLDPRLLTMVIPSRWMAGGRGLADFRAAFLADNRTRVLVDYENAKDVFPTVGIGGGVCYFLWDRDKPGPCAATFIKNGQSIGPFDRRLDAHDVFVRDERSAEILEKILVRGEPSFEGLVSGDTPFGLATNFTAYAQNKAPKADQVRLYANMATKRVQGAMARDQITKNTHLIDVWKLFLPVAGSGRERERNGVDLVLGPSMIGEPGSVCTQTYLVAGPLQTETEALSVRSYLNTRFARFLVSLRKPAQHVFRSMYRWVPVQSWDRTWTDAEINALYGITEEEATHIASLIRPMGGDDE